MVQWFQQQPWVFFVEGIYQLICQWAESRSVPIGTVLMTCTPSLSVISKQVSFEQAL